MNGGLKMTVRKYSKTTVSLLIMILVLLFLAKKLMEWEFSYILIAPFLEIIFDYEYLGIWTALLMKLSILLIVITGVLNVVERESVGLEVFHSLKVPMLMFFSLVIAVHLPIDYIWFCLFVYIVNIFGIAWSYSISFGNCCKDKRNIFTFMFKIKEGATKQNIDKIDSMIFYVLTAALSVCFLILLVFACRYAFINKTVIFGQ